jgi:hypothetical protein
MEVFRCTGIVPEGLRVHKETAMKSESRGQFATIRPNAERRTQKDISHRRLLADRPDL